MVESEITRQERWQRRFLRHVIRPLVPARLISDAGGLQRAESLARAGYGTLVLMNHFSLRDGVQVLHLLYGSEILRRRPTLAPAASHHLEGTLLPALAGRVGIQLVPITTPAAVKRHGLAPASGTNPLLYARQAIAALDNGGIVLLAPQAGRCPALGEPEMRPVSLLLAQALRQHVRDVALLFVGLGIAGVSDYSLEKVGGFNPGLRYEIRVGQTYTFSEALSAAGRLRELDAWAYRRLRNAVPPAYSAPQQPLRTHSQAGRHPKDGTNPYC